MADERATGLRRCHVRTLPLIAMVPSGRDVIYQASVDFCVGLPDARVLSALAVFFAPKPGTAPSAFPAVGPAAWRDLWAPAPTNLAGLGVVARESAGEQGAGLYFVDPIFGNLETRVPLPGGTFGWLLSQRPDAREWYGRLAVGGFGNADADPYAGTWVARATFTDRVGMSAEEFERLADRIYLRKVSGPGACAWGTTGG